MVCWQQLANREYIQIKRNMPKRCVYPIPVAVSPAQCLSVQLDCRLRFSPVTVSPAKPLVHFFFSTAVTRV